MRNGLKTLYYSWEASHWRCRLCEESTHWLNM